MVARREIGFLNAEAPSINFSNGLDPAEFQKFLAYLSEHTGHTIAGLDRTSFLARNGRATSSLSRARYVIADERNKRRVLVSPILRREGERVLITGMCFYDRPGYDVEDSSLDNPLVSLGLQGEYNSDSRDSERLVEEVESHATHYFPPRAAAS